MLHLPQDLLGDVGLLAVSIIDTPCTDSHLPTSTTSSNTYDKRRAQWLAIFSIPAEIQFDDDALQTFRKGSPRRASMRRQYSVLMHTVFPSGARMLREIPFDGQFFHVAREGGESSLNATPEAHGEGPHAIHLPSHTRTSIHHTTRM